jgi:hypothetical protein
VGGQGGSDDYQVLIDDGDLATTREACGGKFSNRGIGLCDDAVRVNCGYLSGMQGMVVATQQVRATVDYFCINCIHPSSIVFVDRY